MGVWRWAKGLLGSLREKWVAAGLDPAEQKSAVEHVQSAFSCMPPGLGRRVERFWWLSAGQALLGN